MESSSQKWQVLIKEVLSPKPKLESVRSQMLDLGLVPGKTLLDCLQIVLTRVEEADDQSALLMRTNNNEESL